MNPRPRGTTTMAIQSSRGSHHPRLQIRFPRLRRQQFLFFRFHEFLRDTSDRGLRGQEQLP